MAEEKATRWQKWEGPGKPPGKGGTTSRESSQPEDVEGRGKKGGVVECYNCGTGFYSLPPDWTWFTCWNCERVNYNFNKS
jgi:hypothetical protein